MRIVVAAGVIERDGKILITRRKADQHLAGLWEFPGGKLEAGEGPEDTVVRECREECAIEVVVDGIMEVTFHAYPGRDVLLLFYACRWVSGEVQHLEVADHAWVAPADLDGYPMPAGDVPVLAAIARRAQSETPSGV